eukprot:12915940-Alexandrium_andersonii.AAC.1
MVLSRAWNLPITGYPSVSALSLEGAAQSVAPTGLGPAAWALQLLVDSWPWRGPVSPSLPALKQ